MRNVDILKQSVAIFDEDRMLTLIKQLETKGEI